MYVVGGHSVAGPEPFYSVIDTSLSFLAMSIRDFGIFALAAPGSRNIVFCLLGWLGRGPIVAINYCDVGLFVWVDYYKVSHIIIRSAGSRPMVVISRRACISYAVCPVGVYSRNLLLSIVDAVLSEPTSILRSTIDG